MKVERYIKELLGIVSEVQNIKYSKTNLILNNLGSRSSILLFSDHLDEKTKLNQ